MTNARRYPLSLPGWEDMSIWGYDPAEMSYFAQLWRNTTDPDEDPDGTVSWFTLQTPITDLAGMARAIGRVTGASQHDVLRAMATAKTAPESPGLEALAALHLIKAGF